MLTRLFVWVEKWAEHHHAKKALALVAFTESSFFPIPPFVLIVAMLMQTKKPSWIQLAFIGTIASVLGGIVGYFIGAFFYEYVGAPLVSFYGVESEVARLGEVFKEHVVMTILLASISPLPYKVFTLSAGLFSVNLWSFIFASIVGRGARFLLVAYLADTYGFRAKEFMLQKQKLTLYSTGVVVFVATLYILFV